MNEQALELSRRRYQTVVRLEETTEGDTCYVAYHPELPNCISQGATPEEAEANLAEATAMVIEHLLAHDLPVPEPRPINADMSPIAEAVRGVESVGLGKKAEARSPVAAVAFARV